VSTTARDAGDKPAAVLAIDGGNSKTDVALVGADGAVLGTASGGGSNPQNLGLDAAITVLDGLVCAAALRAGLDPAGPVAEHTSACLAGADLAVEVERLLQAINERRWARDTHVANDTFALLRAGATRRWGVAVVCGAGINCAGLAPDGREARFPSLGRLSGDWGGGAFLGEEALWWAMRSEDGRGPDTALRQAVAGHFGVQSVAALVEAVHLGDVPWRRLGELSPVLLEVAGRGDRVARRLVGRLGDEVAVMATVAMRRLDLIDVETDVVLGGGVLASGDAALIGRVEARLASAAPKARVFVVSVPPIVGAGLLGLDRLGAGAGAERRLREAFALPRG
jgi:N-acetylglucosamine kinase-like BadF-type ATPase